MPVSLHWLQAVVHIADTEGTAMDIGYFKEFMTLAEEGSFTTAATKLFMTQSSLSRHISSLEEELGSRLFDRKPRSVELTDAGRIVLEETTQIVSSYDSIVERLAAASANNQQVVRVGILTSAKLVGPIIAGFSMGGSGIIPQLVVGTGTEMIEGLLADRCDVTISMRIPFADAQRLKYVHISDDPIVALTSPDDALAKRERISIRELNGRTLVFTAGLVELTQQLQSLLTAHGVHSYNVSFAQSELALPYEVRKTGGVSLVTEMFASDIAGDVSIVHFSERISCEYCWAYKPSSAIPAVRTFIRMATPIVKRQLESRHR